MNQSRMAAKYQWITGIEIVKDTEMKCRLLGVSSQMKTFFGVMLGKLVLVHCDNLSRTLQKRNRRKSFLVKGQWIFEALDLIVSSIKSRFEQPGYQNCHLQDLLLNVAQHRECFLYVILSHSFMVMISLQLF